MGKLNLTRELNGATILVRLRCPVSSAATGDAVSALWSGTPLTRRL